MRYLSLAILLFFSSVQIFAQNQLTDSSRVVLIEQHTGADCGYCAKYNPIIRSLSEAYPFKVAYIQYPFYGKDTLCNPEVLQRSNYYSAYLAPEINVDGNYIAGHPNMVSQDTLENRMNQFSPIKLKTDHWLSDEGDSLFVELKLDVLKKIKGKHKAYVAVIEEKINFNKAPSSNGMTEFYHVFRKMLPDTIGTVLNDSLMKGETYTFDYQYKTDSVFDVSQIAIIAFVQEDSTQEVLQSFYKEPYPYFTQDAHLLNINYPNNKICGNRLSPVIEVKNNGADTITNLQIHYTINNDKSGTYNWKGSLAYADTTEIVLSELVFIPDTSNINKLEVEILSVNQKRDSYSSNNQKVQEFETSPLSAQVVFIEYPSDATPEDTHWYLINDLNDTLYTGKAAEVNTTYFDTLTLSSEHCYQFVMEDSTGKGLDWDKSVSLRDSSDFLIGTIVGEFGYKAILEFGIFAPEIECIVPPQNPNQPMTFEINSNQSLYFDNEPITIQTAEEVIKVKNNCGEEVFYTTEVNNSGRQVIINTSESACNESYKVEITQGLTNEKGIAVKSIQFNSSVLNNALENKDLQVNISPNPAVDFVNIDFVSPVNGKAKIEIYNTNNQQIYSQKISVNKGSNRHTWNCPEARSGLYYIFTRIGENVVITKVVLR